jgi:hypothetical protein
LKRARLSYVTWYTPKLILYHLASKLQSNSYFSFFLIARTKLFKTLPSPKLILFHNLIHFHCIQKCLCRGGEGEKKSRVAFYSAIRISRTHLVRSKKQRKLIFMSDSVLCFIFLCSSIIIFNIYVYSTHIFISLMDFISSLRCALTFRVN